jgi:hypothetical protein
VLLFELESPGPTWKEEGSDYWNWAKPVYRKPQQSWDSTEGFTRQKIWYTKKITPDETDPNQIKFAEWIQCYWDSQAGRWVVLKSGGAPGTIITFRFVTNEYAYGEASEECSERDEPEELLGEVVRVSCGASRPVFGEGEGGIIELTDELGLVTGRDFRTIEGQIGFATLMRNDDEYGYESCFWSILSVNFKRWRQVISDEIWQSDRLKIERELHLVDDHCKLPDEYVIGIDCVEADDYYNTYGQIVG